MTTGPWLGLMIRVTVSAEWPLGQSKWAVSCIYNTYPIDTSQTACVLLRVDIYDQIILLTKVIDPWSAHIPFWLNLLQILASLSLLKTSESYDLEINFFHISDCVHKRCQIAFTNLWIWAITINCNFSVILIISKISLYVRWLIKYPLILWRNLLVSRLPPCNKMWE